MSTKLNGESRERLGQSAKRSAAVHGQARRGATVAGGRPPGVAEQKVGIFCLPGFVEDRGQIYVLRGRTSSFLCTTPERERERKRESAGEEDKEEERRDSRVGGRSRYRQAGYPKDPSSKWVEG